MIDEGDVPSVQREMSVRRSKFMTEVGSPNIILLISVIERLHHVSIELRLRCSFLRT
jgi:hypothetical protein